jgi:hypothetical protein
MRSPNPPPLHIRQCAFLTKFCKFSTFDTQKLAQKEIARQSTRAQFRFLTCGVTCEGKKTTHQLTLERLNWHVLLRLWHWGDIFDENVDVNWHSFSFLKTPRDTLDLKLNVKWKFSNMHIAPRSTSFNDNRITVKRLEQGTKLLVRSLFERDVPMKLISSCCVEAWFCKVGWDYLGQSQKLCRDFMILKRTSMDPSL